MKVSVIIPVYNGANYIKDALESVFSQTYKDYEIIVVNDGSTDDSEIILKPYMDTITYIYQENKGSAEARNTGIRKAKGEYISFLDADDIWLPQKLEKQLKFLLSNPKYKMVFCDIKHSVRGSIIHNSYLHERKYRYVSSGKIYRNLLRECFIFTPTVFVSRECFREVGLFNEKYRICEDYEMWLRIAKKYQIGFLDEPLVERRRHGVNITEDKILYSTSSIDLFKELLKDNYSDKRTKKTIKKELSKRFFNLGYFYWDKINLSFARKNFAKAIKYNKYYLKAAFYMILSTFPLAIIKTIRRLKDAARSKRNNTCV